MSVQLRLSDLLLGHELVDVDLSDMIAASFDAIDDAYREYGAIVIRNQRLTPQDQIAFSRRFGKLDAFALDRFNMKGHPEFFIASNILEERHPIGMEDAGRYWHSALWYTAELPRASHLYTIEVPHNGDEPLGDSWFASTAYAYRTLSENISIQIDGIQAIFSFPKYEGYVSHTAEKEKTTFIREKSSRAGEDKEHRDC